MGVCVCAGGVCVPFPNRGQSRMPQPRSNTGVDLAGVTMPVALVTPSNSELCSLSYNYAQGPRRCPQMASPTLPLGF